jgi:hypothetical protein
VEYPLNNGDIEQWDFHSWSFRQLIPAMIGHFPQPFLSGCRGKVYPTLIVYQDDLEQQAGDLKSCLTKMKVSQVEIRAFERLSEADRADHNLIILAGPQNRFIMDLNEEWKRLGFFAYFNDDELVTIDSDGRTISTYLESTGVIQATQNPWNPNGSGQMKTLY